MVFPLKLKFDACQTFIHFQAVVECQFDTKIKALQSDQGAEYCSITKHLQNQGISHRITCPYSHQQAGAIERCHRQIVEVGLALLAHSNLPKIFWEDAFLTTIFIINRLPTPILQHRSPYEMVHHHKPDYNFLRAFGCACWPYLRPYNRHKMNFRSKTCIFIGYSVGHQGYNCLDVSTGKIFVSRHVIFDQSFYPYTIPEFIELTPKPAPVVLPPNLNLSISSSSVSAGTNVQFTAPSPLHMASTSRPHTDLHIVSGSPTRDATLSQHEDRPTPLLLPSPPRPQHQNIHSMITRTKNNIHKPKFASDFHIRYPFPKHLWPPSNRQKKNQPAIQLQLNITIGGRL